MANENKPMTAEQKVSAYEDLLGELMQKETKREGKVTAGPAESFYKVQMENEEIIASSPMFTPKLGASVIVVNGVIVRALPEALVGKQEDPVEFERITWESIGGLQSQIESIRRKIEYPEKYKSIYKEFAMPESKGILLHGPTGCGKTLVAKAIASSMLKTKFITRDMFIYQKGGELLSRYVGAAEAKIKDTFETARHTYKKKGVRPIIFIDEAEAILPHRGSGISSDVERTIVPTFLSEMDGFEGHNPFVLLATNFADRIDDAILRPGRIDMKIYIGPPTVEDSVDIFKIYLAKTKISGDMEQIARGAAKYLHSVEKLDGIISGALIENIVSFAIELAIVRKIKDSSVRTGVTLDDIVQVINTKK